MSTDREIDRLLEDIHPSFLDATRAEMAAVCESPIECMFFLQLRLDGWRQPTERDWRAVGYSSDGWRESLGIQPSKAGPQAMLLCQPGSSSAFVVQPTLRIGGHVFRPDVAAFVDGGERFAIDFDGHEFHERTKEQAKRDRERDRAFTLDGWKVLRFTGSEVYADVWGVYVEVIDAIVAAYDRAFDPQAHMLRGPAAVSFLLGRLGL